jgi:hypothetical protein
VYVAAQNDGIETSNFFRVSQANTANMNPSPLVGARMQVIMALQLKIPTSKFARIPTKQWKAYFDGSRVYV